MGSSEEKALKTSGSRRKHSTSSKRCSASLTPRCDAREPSVSDDGSHESARVRSKPRGESRRRKVSRHRFSRDLSSLSSVSSQRGQCSVNNERETKRYIKRSRDRERRRESASPQETDARVYKYEENPRRSSRERHNNVSRKFQNQSLSVDRNDSNDKYKSHKSRRSPRGRTPKESSYKQRDTTLRRSRSDSSKRRHSRRAESPRRKTVIHRERRRSVDESPFERRRGRRRSRTRSVSSCRASPRCESPCRSRSKIRERGKDETSKRRAPRDRRRDRSLSSPGRAEGSVPNGYSKSSKRSKWDVPLSNSKTSKSQSRGPTSSGSTGGEELHSRRLYIGNLPPGVTDLALVQFLNGALLAASGMDYAVAAFSGLLPVYKSELIVEHRYSLVDFRSVPDAVLCLKLDGILFSGYPLKIAKPNDVDLPRPPEKTASDASLGGTNRNNADVKMYVTDLPITVTDEELRRMCEAFGTVRAAALMKDLKTGQSMGCGFVEFEDPASTDAAVKVLDRKPIGANIPRFHKGSLVPGITRLTGAGDRATHTSSVVTELPSSVTYKIFNNAIIGAQVKAARQEGAKPSNVVQLLNAVFPEDLIRDEEYEAIMEDMRNEASQYGTLINVVIPRPPEDLSFKPGVGKVFLHFSDTTAARRAQAELNGRTYDQRRVICAAFYGLDRFLEGKYTLV